MALISCNLNFEDEGDFEFPAKANYTWPFVGVSNNRFDTPLSVARDRLCPQMGRRDPVDPRAFVKNVNAKRRAKSHYVWDITVQSTTEFDPDEDES